MFKQRHLLPSSNNSVLGSEAVDRPVLHTESDHPFTLSILHQQVQGKILHKVTGVITKWLKTSQADAQRHLTGAPRQHKDWKKVGKYVYSPFHTAYAAVSGLFCLLHSSSGAPDLPFHT